MAPNNAGSLAPVGGRDAIDEPPLMKDVLQVDINPKFWKQAFYSYTRFNFP
jgi:hypothetical protein